MIEAGTGHYFMPATVKGACWRDGQVLLGQLHHGGWDLPGGWPGPEDAGVADALIREVAEESGLAVRPGPHLLTELFHPRNGNAVLVALFQAEVTSAGAPVISHEHQQMRFFDPAALPEPLPAPYRRAIALSQQTSSR